MVLISFREPYVPGESGKSFNNLDLFTSKNTTVVIQSSYIETSKLTVFLSFTQIFFSSLSPADCK